MDRAWWIVVVMLFGVRLSALWRFWQLPHRYGPDRFHTVKLDPDRLAATAPLVRRYRAWLFAPFAIDAVLVPLLVATDRTHYLLHQQFVSMVVTAIFFRCLLVHFSFRMRQVAPLVEVQGPTRVQLSLATRRLRDHTRWWIELPIAASVIASVTLLAIHGGAPGRTSDGERSPTAGLLWLLYLQLGLVLLKSVFVRTRMKLPAVRTEDYVRWRTAWLTYHLRIFDVMRAAMALAVLQLAVNATLGERLAIDRSPEKWIAWSVVLIWLTAYATRERRRLAGIEREVRPAELTDLVPPTPVADGRFLAGGLLYFNRDNPALLARSKTGVALNLANTSTYLWAAYLLGLALLAAYVSS